MNDFAVGDRINAWLRGCCARLRPFALACTCFLLLLALGGCAAFHGYPKRAIARDVEIAQMAHDISGTEISKCLATTDPACRNRIIAAKMYVTDLQFSAFEETLFRGTREAAFGATLGTLGLTSAAAVASGGTSQVLAGSAALIIGGREAFQKEVLSERTVIAIHTAMRGGRARIAARILEGLRQPVDTYPLSLGLRDLNEYYDAGTILGALVGITETVGATTREAEQDLQRTLTYRITPAIEKLRMAVCNRRDKCEKLDPAKLAEMRRCWPGAGVPSTTFVIDFMFDPKFEATHESVVKCMKL